MAGSLNSIFALHTVIITDEYPKLKRWYVAEYVTLIMWATMD